jgi:hypothetical protein
MILSPESNRETSGAFAPRDESRSCVIAPLVTHRSKTRSHRSRRDDFPSQPSAAVRAGTNYKRSGIKSERKLGGKTNAQIF